MLSSNICVLVFATIALSYCLKNDDQQCSKFHYEEQLLEKMIRLEIKFETLLDNVGKLEESIKEERRLMNEERIASKEDLDNWIKDKEASVTSIIDKIENKFEDSERKFGIMVDDLKGKQNNIIEGASDNLMSIKQRIVAYEAHVVQKLNPSEGEIIVFTDTLLNEGDGYDNTTGIFTVPENGLYLIMVQFCIRFDKSIRFDILWNGIILTTAKFYRGRDEHFSCYSTQTAVKASIGEGIWIESNKHHMAETLYNSRYFVNAFTGVLVN